jgi:hypothetical protein
MKVFIETLPSIFFVFILVTGAAERHKIVERIIERYEVRLPVMNLQFAGCSTLLASEFIPFQCRSLRCAPVSPTMSSRTIFSTLDPRTVAAEQL